MKEVPKEKKEIDLTKLKNGTKAVVFAIAGVLVSLFIVAIVMLVSIYVSYKQSFKSAKIRTNTTQTVYYDKNGEVIYEGYGARAPQALKLAEVPAIIKNATIASEDAGFYEHGAVDPKGLLRAAVINVKNSEKPGLLKASDLFKEQSYTQGGSTITQQLVKNIYLSTERSFERKAKEIVYSYELEKKWSKDKILEEYLNNVYYGEQSLGIENAAKNYYGKSAKDLTLGEASMLAGVTVAPTRLSPVSGNFDEAKKRQEYVLSKMYRLGMISFEEAKTAANEPLYFSEKGTANVKKAPYFVDYLKQKLADKIGEEALESGGLKIYTTLDLKKQTEAEKIAREYMRKFAYRKVTNTAIVVLDNKTQEITAMVGGVDYEKSKVNVATAARQPGSSFKPLVYTTGLLGEYSAATILADRSVNFGGTPPYRPKNYDGSYHGNVTVRTALQNSLNIPAVEMTSLVGVEEVIKTAEKMGITTLTEPKRYGLSIGLGAAEVKLLELAEAYSTFPRGGEAGDFVGITKIVDNENATIYTQPKSSEETIDKRVAYIMTNILSDNNARKMVFGSYSPLYFRDRKVGAKTGTTDDYADSWTMGFTPQYTVGVWMGNNDHSKMSRVSGIEGAAYIWHDVMAAIHKGQPAEDFKKPEGLTELYINSRTGTLAKSQRKPYQLEYFIPGTEPGTKVDLSYLNVFRGTTKRTFVKTTN